MADSYNPIITQGETWSLSLTVTGVNLSGYSARSKGKSSHASTTNLWSKSTTAGGMTITAGTNSVVTLTLSAAETAALSAWSAGVFDIEYESAGGVVTNILKGYFIVQGEVTSA